jgi:hypothetical protein
MAPVFGHQGGWDELAMFVIPIVIAVIGVRIAEARAKRRNSDVDDTPEIH